MRAQPGAGRDSWSLVARTLASRASRCAAVSQTRTPTRLPVGTSVWHVTFESACEAFESGSEVAVVEATAACAGAAPAAGAFPVAAWSMATDVQPPTRTPASRIVAPIPLEVCMDSIH